MIHKLILYIIFYEPKWNVNDNKKINYSQGYTASLNR